MAPILEVGKNIPKLWKRNEEPLHYLSEEVMAFHIKYNDKSSLDNFKINTLFEYWYLQFVIRILGSFFCRQL